MPASTPLIIPTALVGGDRAVSMVDGGIAHWLAGGPLAFAAVEVVEDGGKRSLLNAEALKRRTDLNPVLERLIAPRHDFAGLALEPPRVMGIVNVTPDSFSDGGDFADAEAAIAQGGALAEAGADILDIGGESTRPGAAPISVGEEIDRVIPVIEGLIGHGAAISIDTRNAATMRAAMAAGASIINDVSALEYDPESRQTAAGLGVPVILMHMRGEPSTMREKTTYDDLAREVFDELAAQVEAAVAAGIPRAKIAVDPGIGFAKTQAQNPPLLRDLAALHGLGCALAFGVSRKSFLSAITGERDPKRLIGASIAAALAGLSAGAQIVRVHDVRETVQAMATSRAIADGSAD